MLMSANILFLKKFRFAQSDENFLRENSLSYNTANIWRAVDMYENIVIRKILAQILRTKLILFCE
jgi:hypothetical protein